MNSLELLCFFVPGDLCVAGNSTEPAYSTLIDTGALVTGMTNLEVAQYLLLHGLPDMQGVVYLDSKVPSYLHT